MVRKHFRHIALLFCRVPPLTPPLFQLNTIFLSPPPLPPPPFSSFLLNPVNHSLISTSSFVPWFSPLPDHTATGSASMMSTRPKSPATSTRAGPYRAPPARSRRHPTSHPLARGPPPRARRRCGSRPLRRRTPPIAAAAHARLRGHRPWCHGARRGLRLAAVRAAAASRFQPRQLATSRREKAPRPRVHWLQLLRLR